MIFRFGARQPKPVTTVSILMTLVRPIVTTWIDSSLSPEPCMYRTQSTGDKPSPICQDLDSKLSIPFFYVSMQGFASCSKAQRTVEGAVNTAILGERDRSGFSAHQICVFLCSFGLTAYTVMICNAFKSFNFIQLFDIG